MKKQRLIFMLATLALLLSVPGVASAVVDKKQDVKRITTERLDQPMTLKAPNAQPSQPVAIGDKNTSGAGKTSSAPQRAVSETITVNGVSFAMVKVEGGTYTRGATSGQGEFYTTAEQPAHPVTVSSFSMGTTEVTQELWQAVMGYNPSRFSGDLQRPVENVAFLECQDFIFKLNELTGRRFRLPSEAEWEYAARGGKHNSDFMYAGSNNIDDVAWYCDNSDNTTHPVATKAPNELGIYDLTGNVNEWCQDGYARYSSFPQETPTINPWGFEESPARMLRGGSFSSDLILNRVSKRYNDYWYTRSEGIGLRLVISDMQGQNISFFAASQNETVTSSDTFIPVAITRGDTQGTYTAEVWAEPESFNVTPLQCVYVTFDEGQNVAYLQVPFNGMSVGETYSCTLSLSQQDAQTTNPEYGQQILSTTLSVKNDLNWENAGTARFIDHIATDGDQCDVQVLKTVLASDQVRYRMVRPYQTLFANSSDATYFTNDGDFEFTLSSNGDPISVESGNMIEGYYEFFYDPVNWGSYCTFTRQGNHYYVKGLLAENGTPIYIAEFEFIYDLGQSSVAAPAIDTAPKAIRKTISPDQRKKVVVPIKK